MHLGSNVQLVMFTHISENETENIEMKNTNLTPENNPGGGNNIYIKTIRPLQSKSGKVYKKWQNNQASFQATIECIPKCQKLN